MGVPSADSGMEPMMRTGPLRTPAGTKPTILAQNLTLLQGKVTKPKGPICRRAVHTGMVDERRVRANKLKEAYEEYYQLLTSMTTAGSRDLMRFDAVVGDAKTRSDIALKMALAELIRPA